MKDICLTREMLCGHSADIVRTYISRNICPHNVRTISFFGFQLRNLQKQVRKCPHLSTSVSAPGHHLKSSRQTFIRIYGRTVKLIWRGGFEPQKKNKDMQITKEGEKEKNKISANEETFSDAQNLYNRSTPTLSFSIRGMLPHLFALFFAASHEFLPSSEAGKWGRIQIFSETGIPPSLGSFPGKLFPREASPGRWNSSFWEVLLKPFRESNSSSGS